MTGLKWLKLNKTSIDWIPEQLGNLKNMESLSFAKNNLITLHGEISQMPSLKYLNCKNNRIKNSGIPNDLFKSKDLLILDLSYNQLKEVPPDLDQMKNLQVLNLCHNQIETIPNQLFINLTELVILDLSDNKLETLPPQMRRLVNLNTLILNNNPLGHNQLRQLPSLTSLTTLHLRNTQRILNNIPSSLEALTNLIDLDLAQNQLNRLPEALYTLPKLKRLNLSDNSLSELPVDVPEYWKNLEILNLSRNNLTSLPTTISKLQKLRRLYLCSNKLDFDGIPSSISKLSQLEVLTASNNNLEMITEGLFRCLKLKKLILSNNKLITLPDTVHLLTDLEELDLANNQDLVMPPKPPEYQYYSKGSGLEYYNIDFSLPNQLRLAGAPTPLSLQSPNSTPSKDPIARKMRLRRKHRDSVAKDDDGTNQAKVLKGMSDLAKDKNNKSFDEASKMDALNLKFPKRWDESLEKPRLDYSEFFDSHVGQSPGIFIWEIENFLPNIIDDEFHGKFYEADCYIVLKTFTDENQSLDWQIFYWIGLNSPLDKKACSAIHAVNLRNYLGAQCRTIREEQNDESEEFLALFPDGIMYIEGGRTPSGFFTVEETEIIHRMYRLHELPNLQRQLYLETVPIDVESLDPKFVFVLDAGYIIYVWNGKKAKNTMKQKGRLLAEKINKEERKNKAEIMFCAQNDEPEDFWKEILGYTRQKRNINSDDTLDSEPMMTEEDFEEKRKAVVVQDHVDLENFRPFHPILYLVGLGMGFLEISQIDFKEGKLKPSLLEPKSVYILDCSSDLFVWFGRKSPRLVKAAALKLSQELYSMINRPEYALITRCLQGTEPQVFKSKFSSWDNVIAVDFTRTADSVARTGANLHQWMSKQDVKIDTSALFMLRQPELDKESARQLTEEWNDELGLMEVLLLEGKKFVKLPENEIGHFYSQDCYVVFCKYWVSDSSADDENNNFSGNDDEANENYNNKFQCVVYFWQGREAPNMGWLTFTFSLQVKFQALFEDKLEIERTYQQKENYKFLSHFKGKYVVHLGKRKPPALKASTSSDQIENGLDGPSNTSQYIDDRVEMYYLRSNSCPLAFRCIQVLPEAAILNSGFSYILKVPKGINEGVAYVWIGDKCDPDEAKMAEKIALDMYNSENYRVSILNEGEEPEEFWAGLGGKKLVDKDCSFMKYTRLFRYVFLCWL